jgi:aryl-alcohol dehydrogenase-like predicted oxidoreductase
MIEKKVFGKTGHLSTRVIFGGAAMGRDGLSETESENTLDRLLEYGINHLDLAARYGNGMAEKRVGEWMNRIRDDIFLATKTGMRTYQEARDEFYSSLERLQVDSVDLIQIHNLTGLDEWETAMGPGGVLEALIAIREEKLTRFIGVTGHGMTAPEMHLRSIEQFDFDSVLLPYNFLIMQDPKYARDFHKLVETCNRRNIAVQTIKSIARRPWGEREKLRGCWYEPLEKHFNLTQAVHWVLGHPDVFLITVGDINVLPKVLEAAGRTGSRPADADMQEMAEVMDMEPIFRGRQPIMKQ